MFQRYRKNRQKFYRKSRPRVRYGKKIFPTLCARVLPEDLSDILEVSKLPTDALILIRIAVYEILQIIQTQFPEFENREVLEFSRRVKHFPEKFSKHFPKNLFFMFYLNSHPSNFYQFLKNIFSNFAFQPETRFS